MPGVGGIVIDLRDKRRRRASGGHLAGRPVHQEGPGGAGPRRPRDHSRSFGSGFGHRLPRVPWPSWVNRLSASASEIFAGSASGTTAGAWCWGGQDLRQGDGTDPDPDPRGSPGSTEAHPRPSSTVKKISGDSTQHRGVIPDIELPGVIDKTEVGGELSRQCAGMGTPLTRPGTTGPERPRHTSMRSRRGTTGARAWTRTSST